MLEDVMIKRAPDMAAMVPYWDLTDNLIDGIEAMQLAGEKYLLRFPGEETVDYQFRLKNAVMTNVFNDIVESLASKPFEREIEFVGEAPDAEMINFASDVDGSGNNLSVVASGILFRGINSAIDWIFVDHPPADPSVRSVADAKKAGNRPFWSCVLGRNMLEARSSMSNGKEMLDYVRILEPGEPDHVRIIERQKDGSITWQLHKKTDKYNEEKKTHFVLEDSGIITIDEIPLVPFITGRRDGRSFKLDPALRGAAEKQLHLYRQESGLEFTTILTAYPMLAGNGVKPDMESDGKTIKKLSVGPSRVLYAPPNGDGKSGSWSYVEPNANSLMFLSAYIKEIILNLRELGRQPLTASSSNLTTVTTAFAAGKSKSSVKAWAGILEDALNNAFRITAKFMNRSDYPTVNVYKEFDDFADGKDYDTLLSARAAGDISLETFWEESKRRGLLSIRFDPLKERQRLLNDIPGDETEGNM